MCHHYYNTSKLLIMYFIDGFFDAGMLFQALKARGNTTEEETKASERAAVNAKRRDVGKKLRLVTE